MTYYDEQLRRLQEQAARSRHLKAIIQELRSQRDALAARVSELEAQKLDEQADVEQLEHRSLAAFFYNVIGKMDERLDKERAEAYAASVKCDAVAKELAAVEEALRQSEAELAGLEGCEARYQAALNQKTRAVKAAGGPDAAEILRLQARFDFLKSQRTELGEAISAGNTAFKTTDRILSKLSSAHNGGTWDLIGGGPIAEMVKHDNLDKAQDEVELLQSQLREFKTELADVTVQADMQVNVEGFLRFADYFFDGLFVDWVVMDKISQSQEQVQAVKAQIEQVLSSLHAMIKEVDQEQACLNSRLETLLQEARL